jgi:hypothetical protein
MGFGMLNDTNRREASAVRGWRSEATGATQREEEELDWNDNV